MGCMDVDEERVPEHYRCERCDPYAHERNAFAAAHVADSSSKSSSAATAAAAASAKKRPAPTRLMDTYLKDFTANMMASAASPVKKRRQTLNSRAAEQVWIPDFGFLDSSEWQQQEELLSRVTTPVVDNNRAAANNGRDDEDSVASDSTDDSGKDHPVVNASSARKQNSGSRRSSVRQDGSTNDRGTPSPSRSARSSPTKSSSRRRVGAASTAAPIRPHASPVSTPVHSHKRSASVVSPVLGAKLAVKKPSKRQAALRGASPAAARHESFRDAAEVEDDAATIDGNPPESAISTPAMDGKSRRKTGKSTAMNANGTGSDPASVDRRKERKTAKPRKPYEWSEMQDRYVAILGRLKDGQFCRPGFVDGGDGNKRSLDVATPPNPESSLVKSLSDNVANSENAGTSTHAPNSPTTWTRPVDGGWASIGLAQTKLVGLLTQWRAKYSTELDVIEAVAASEQEEEEEADDDVDTSTPARANERRRPLHACEFGDNGASDDMDASADSDDADQHGIVKGCTSTRSILHGGTHSGLFVRPVPASDSMTCKDNHE